MRGMENSDIWPFVPTECYMFRRPPNQPKLIDRNRGGRQQAVYSIKKVTWETILSMQKLVVRDTRTSNRISLHSRASCLCWRGHVGPTSSQIRRLS